MPLSEKQRKQIDEFKLEQGSHALTQVYEEQVGCVMEMMAFILQTNPVTLVPPCVSL